MVSIKQIQHGFAFIRSCQNEDGGIGYDSHGQVSSPLTTGECLATCASSPYFSAAFSDCIYRMARYLLLTQSPHGFWHFALDPDVLTTSFALAGLCNARAVVKADQALSIDVGKAIAKGIGWLSSVYNTTTGGWAITPVADPARAPEALTTPTCYCLEVYHLLGPEYADSEPAKSARTFLNSIRNSEDGGWGFAARKPSDVGSTARVLDVLSSSGLYANDSLVIQGGIDYLLKHRTSRPVWDIEPERFGAATGFYANCPADATKALLRAGYRGREVADCLEWFAKTQYGHDGHWILQDTKQAQEHHVHADLTTWPTRDAVDTLSLAAERVESRPTDRTSHAGLWRILALVFLLIAIVQALLLIGVGQLVKP